MAKINNRDNISVFVNGVALKVAGSVTIADVRNITENTQLRALVTYADGRTLHSTVRVVELRRVLTFEAFNDLLELVRGDSSAVVRIHCD